MFADAVADTDNWVQTFGFLRGIQRFLIGDCWTLMWAWTRRRHPVGLVELSLFRKLYFIMISTCARKVASSIIHTQRRFANKTRRNAAATDDAIGRVNE